MRILGPIVLILLLVVFDTRLEYPIRRHPDPRPAKAVNASVDFEEHLIQVPLVTRPRRSAAQTVGVSLTELEAPFSDRLIRKGDTATGHQFLDIAKAQREAKVEPDAMTDDLSGKAMTIIKRDDAHPCSMQYERADCLFVQLT